jgi:transposase
VVAPSLIPRKAGDRIKTNRRDAESFAKLLRAGEQTSVWVPDSAHESIRDLSRAREAAVADLKRKRLQVLKLLLRHGLHYPDKRTLGKAHRTWLASVKLAERSTRLDRLNAALRDSVPAWSLGSQVVALMALRGIDLLAAVVLLAEIGGVSRFSSAPELMAWLGLVPSESSTGDKVRRGPITKAGNSRARRILIEAAWSYRHPPRVGVEKAAHVAAAPRPAREIAWKAQTRLSARYRRLAASGKRQTVVVTAIARELTGFIWDICRQTMPAATAVRACGPLALEGARPAHRPSA